MKKTIAIWICMALVVSATTVTGYRMYQNSKMTDLMKANLEALSNSEENRPIGRWKTVGCGGISFDKWKTYCCPNEYYDNCPNKGNCNSSPIHGC